MGLNLLLMFFSALTVVIRRHEGVLVDVDKLRWWLRWL